MYIIMHFHSQRSYVDSIQYTVYIYRYIYIYVLVASSFGGIDDCRYQTMLSWWQPTIGSFVNPGRSASDNPFQMEILGFTTQTG